MPRPESGRVFGLGLSKTGTTSLGDALNALGFRTIHYPYDRRTLRQLERGDFRLTLLEKYDGVVDISLAPFYAELDEAWPGSKFILTVREKTSWLRSAEHHWYFLREWAKRNAQFKKFTRFICARVYGTWEFDRRQFARAYDLHTRNVREYFEGRPEDFLVMDMTAGDSWDKLCRFLGCPVPDIPLPHSNKRRDKAAADAWMRRLDLAAGELGAVVTPGEKVVLVDGNELVGTALTTDFDTVPFLERDGRYWGSPPDDETAIHELSRLREEGAGYIVFSWPAFWWVTSYPDFLRHLETRYDCLLRNERLIVFDLRPRRPRSSPEGA